MKWLILVIARPRYSSRCVSKVQAQHIWQRTQSIIPSIVYKSPIKERRDLEGSAGLDSSYVKFFAKIQMGFAGHRFECIYVNNFSQIVKNIKLADF